MKIISNSMKKHWAIGYYISCVRCDSVYMLENLEDFRTQTNDRTVTSQCPVCSHRNTTIKSEPWKVTTPYWTPWGVPNKWIDPRDLPYRRTIMYNGNPTELLINNVTSTTGTNAR